MDVDIKSRNIIFIGDVYVHGTVTEGMRIIANSVNIAAGSFKSNIKVNDSSLILGNIGNVSILGIGSYTSEILQWRTYSSLRKHLKDVHVYRDKRGELIIDKLNL